METINVRRAFLVAAVFTFGTLGSVTWLPGANALEFDSAALNRFIASRPYLVDWRIVVARWQLVLQDTVERIGTASDWLEPKIDGHSRSKRSWSGYV